MIHFQEVHGEVSINISRGRKGNDEKYRYVLLDFNKKHYLCLYQQKAIWKQQTISTGMDWLP